MKHCHFIKILNNFSHLFLLFCSSLTMSTVSTPLINSHGHSKPQFQTSQYPSSTLQAQIRRFLTINHNRQIMGFIILGQIRRNINV